MVIFGGLELVAAGYIIHKHNQNKRERRRLEEEAEALEEEEYYRRHPEERRRRSLDDREYDHHSYDQRPGYDHAASSQTQRPVGEKRQYLGPEYYAQPPRPSSAPPQEPQNPPTGWPENWKQSQMPDPNRPPNYAQANPGQYAAQYPPYQGPPGGSSQQSRYPAQPSSPHVHFAETPSEVGSGRRDRRRSRRGDGSSDGRSSEYSDPPPAYRE